MTGSTQGGCIFCAIASAPADASPPPAAFVGRGDGWCAFLDRAPVFKGHVLVVPTGHHETLADLPAEQVGPLFVAVQTIARLLPAALEADGTFVAANNTISQSVPHLHVHVVPRKKKDGLRGFFWPRQKYAPGEIDLYADTIAKALRDA